MRYIVSNHYITILLQISEVSLENNSSLCYNADKRTHWIQNSKSKDAISKKKFALKKIAEMSFATRLLDDLRKNVAHL